jgi:hypothetical protein
MTPFKLFERSESYCLVPSKIGTITGKYRALQKHNLTYLSLNRFFYLATAKVVPEFQNQASERRALQHKEGLEW